MACSSRASAIFFQHKTIIFFEGRLVTLFVKRLLSINFVFEEIAVSKGVFKEILFIIDSSELKHLSSCKFLSREFSCVVASEKLFSLNQRLILVILRLLILSVNLFYLVFIVDGKYFC